MSRKNRPKKTLDRQLHDLEDHLYFLKESLAKLTSGDDGYLKLLAAELRVLVCDSSQTDGLLWRILDEYQIQDAVHVHLAGNLNREHPLSRGITFIFAPVLPAGQGDPQLVPDYYSLKHIIKECEALVITEIGYTHEKLIRQVAQQMGSAHEDDGADSHLIELSATLLSNQSTLNKVLMLDANLVLEVGERAIAWAVKTQNFVLKDRAEIVIPHGRNQLFPDDNTGDFEYSFSPLTPEGTMLFSVSHPHSDWLTNSNAYQFDVIRQGPLSVRAFKHIDKNVVIHVGGLCESIVSTRQFIPNTDQTVMTVAVSWDRKAAKFFACGEHVDTVEYTLANFRSANRRQLDIVGRNSPCPCGSGKKYKTCCGKFN